MAVVFQSITHYKLHARKSGQYVPITLVDETDLKTLEPGITTTITVEISKNGAAYAATSDGAVTEIGNGDYVVSLDETDTDSVGLLMLRAIKSGVVAETKVICSVSIDAAAEASMAETIRRIIRMERLK